MFRWLTLFGFDLQITASSPEPGTQTPHSCKSKLLLPQLSQPLVLLSGAVRSWHSKKSSAGWGTSGATATNCLNQRVRPIFFVCDKIGDNGSEMRWEKHGTHPRLQRLESKPKNPKATSESWCCLKLDLE